jgi:hypothetical protein
MTTRTRTKFESIFDNRCSITYWDDMSERTVTEEFFAPSRGGYVKLDDGRNYPQVCDGLYSTGDTLEWYPRSGPLVKMVRREWRRRRALERR